MEMDNKQVFIDYYLRDYTPIDKELFLQKFAVVPCTCGKKDCMGWKMDGDFGLPF